MSILRAVISNAAARLSGASPDEAGLEADVRRFLTASGFSPRSLKSLACEEPRHVYFGEVKLDGVTMTVIVAADPDLGALGGAVVSNVTGAQLQLLRYEWTYSIASCIRFYDYLLDKLNVHARLGEAAAR